MLQSPTIREKRDHVRNQAVTSSLILAPFPEQEGGDYEKRDQSKSHIQAGIREEIHRGLSGTD